MKLKATIKRIVYSQYDGKTKCKIWFIDPYLNTQRIAIGVAKCNREDAFSVKLGQHIAEGRAKINMWLKLITSNDNSIMSINRRRIKYESYIETERLHINDLINPKKNEK